MGVYGRLDRIKELAECILANVDAEKAGLELEPQSIAEKWGLADPPEPAAEPEPPCAMLPNPGIPWLRIDVMRPRPNCPDQTLCDGEVLGHGHAHGWRVEGLPFSIWQECVRKGVRCCDPPSITVAGDVNPTHEFICVLSLEAIEGGRRVVKGWGRTPSSNDAHYSKWHGQSWVYAEPSLSEIRALCDAAGVPRPEEEPKTVSIPTLGNFTVKFAAITSITAAWDDGRACLRVVGDGNSMTHVFTTTPLADIRAQAEAAGMELPNVTVNIDGYRWTVIERADCHVCDDGSLLTGIIGVAEQYGEHTIHTSTLTPAQVVRLCELAGWPRPDVRCVFTHCDGSACELPPDGIAHVHRHDRPYTKGTQIDLKQWDGEKSWCVVREPVAQVETMRDACKGGE